jgi:DHA1 family bicyclomycin/chloramphenicol resistance-like MFS transporter
MLLGAITALGSLAIHMFVPAMPIAAAMLRASPSVMQLTLTLYLVGVGTGQIVSGPLADHVGRRPVLLGGVAIFVLGSAICWAAGSVWLLLAGRLIQALGASAGLVVGRAMTGDTAEGRGARDMALLTAIVMLSPMIAPLLGSVLADSGGWRAIFAVLTVLGLACGIAAMRWLPETFVPRPADGTSLLANWARVLTNRVFLRNLLLGTSFTAGLYVFLGASPFLLVDFYRADPHGLGIYYGAVALGAGAGALSVNRLAGRLGSRSLMRLGASLAAAGAIGFLVGAALGLHEIAAMIVPMAVFSFGGGLVVPNAFVAALAGSPDRVGTAVSAFGALQMLGNAAVSSLVAALAPHSPVPVAVAIAMLALLTMILTIASSAGPDASA